MSHILSETNLDERERGAGLTALMELHNRADDDDVRAEARLAFLSVARLEPPLSEKRERVEFLLEATNPKDFSFFAWKRPEDVFSFCELLLGFS